MAVNNGRSSTYFTNRAINPQPSRQKQSPSGQYSQAQILQMRQDAIRRTNELHSRSTNSHDTEYRSQGSPQSRKQSSPPSDRFTPPAPNSTSQAPTKNTLKDILSGLGLSEISGENAIILLLIVLLVKEKKSMKLVLALAYLLL